MMKGMKELRALIKSLEARANYLDSLNGQIIDEWEQEEVQTEDGEKITIKEDNSLRFVLTGGPHLHQGTEEMSEEESAKEEMENPRVFQNIRKIEQDLRGFINNA